MEIARPSVKLNNLVMDCSDAKALASFYEKLLGWEKQEFDNGYAAVTDPDTGFVIAFQPVADYEPPVWPWQKGRQSQMMHFDLMVENLEEGVAFALQCGATLADSQYFNSSRTMFDPAGHPFCVDTEGVD